jgi:ATP-binding cassette subfamily F protein uup
MSLVSIRNVHLSFGGLDLLDDLSVQIDSNEKVCLVGRNGAGKSTLLKVIDREVEPDDGMVEHKKGIRVSRLSQEIQEDLKGAVFQIVSGGLQGVSRLENGEGERWVNTVVSRLGLDGKAEFSLLSGGTKRRCLLARALVADPDLLILDEPTNHLDIDSIAWLEEFLSKRRGALLFVSHDRAFVRKLATRIVELDRGKITSWPGDWEKFVLRKREALETESKQRAVFDKKLAEEEAWKRKGIRARRTRNEGRVRELQKLRQEKRARLDVLGKVQMTAQEAERSGKKVLVAKNVGFSYGEKPLLKGLSTTVMRGDKIGIIGPNGVGKTTLLMLLTGQLKPSEGSLRIGERLEIAYLDQLREELLDDKTVIENVVAQGDTVTIHGRSKHIIGYLKDFLFTPDAARSPVRNLSGGERNRLLLAKLFAKPSNLLVVDEPTNDLDVDTLELLEERLVEYSGSILLVSHDREFLNNVVTSTLVFEGDGKIVEYAGGYDDWLHQRETNEETSGPHKRKKTPRVREKKLSVRKLTFKERLELEQLPGKIEALEEELEQLREKMADPDFYKTDGALIKDAVSRMEVLEPQLEEIYGRWEQLELLNK